MTDREKKQKPRKPAKKKPPKPKCPTCGSLKLTLAVDARTIDGYGEWVERPDGSLVKRGWPMWVMFTQCKECGRNWYTSRQWKKVERDVAEREAEFARRREAAAKDSQ